MPADRTSMEIGSDSWSARGFDLKTLISQVYDVDTRRVDYPDGASDRYDITLTLLHEENQDEVKRLLQEVLKKRFRLSITPESRPMDVYVLTAPNGPGTGLHRHISSSRISNAVGLSMQNAPDEPEAPMDDMQQITFIGKDCSGVSSGAGISMTAGTIAEFRRTLEPDMDRLLIDETGLEGTFDFQIGGYANHGDLFKLMHDQLGIAVTPDKRKVTVLTVRSADSLQAKL